MNEEAIRQMFELYNNPSFKKGFGEFFVKMQQEGLEAARKFWSLQPEKSKLFDISPNIFEQMIEFYSNIGFVPRKKYDEAIKENVELKKKNEFLQKTIKELHLKIFTEEGRKTQDIWKSTIEKQMEANKEISKSFFDLFKA
jgi:regulator of replication initiation timing